MGSYSDEKLANKQKNSPWKNSLISAFVNLIGRTSSEKEIFGEHMKC